MQWLSNCAFLLPRSRRTGWNTTPHAASPQLNWQRRTLLSWTSMTAWVWTWRDLRTYCCWHQSQGLIRTVTTRDHVDHPKRTRLPCPWASSCIQACQIQRRGNWSLILRCPSWQRNSSDQRSPINPGRPHPQHHDTPPIVGWHRQHSCLGPNCKEHEYS